MARRLVTVGDDFVLDPKLRLARSSLTGTQLASTISDFAETTQDVIAATLITGSGISLAYNDTANTLTISAPDVVTRLKPRGEFAAGVAYQINDLVHVGDNSFYALQAHTSALPAPAASSAFWKQLGSAAASTGGGTGSVSLPAGLVVERRYVNGAYPVRGTLDATIVVEWVGPTAPPVGGNYAVAGKDRWTVTP